MYPGPHQKCVTSGAVRYQQSCRLSHRIVWRVFSVFVYLSGGSARAAASAGSLGLVNMALLHCAANAAMLSRQTRRDTLGIGTMNDFYRKPISALRARFSFAFQPNRRRRRRSSRIMEEKPRERETFPNTWTLWRSPRRRNGRHFDTTAPLGGTSKADDDETHHHTYGRQAGTLSSLKRNHLA